MPTDHTLEQWTYQADPENHGLDLNWQRGLPDSATEVTLPLLSSQAATHPSEVNWYATNIEVGKRTEVQGDLYVRFESVDHSCLVYLNGESIGGHVGAEEPFDVELPPLDSGTHSLVVRVHEPKSAGRYGPALDAVPHRNREDPFRAGAAWPSGGIPGSVQLRSRSTVSIIDSWTTARQGDPSTIDVSISFLNRGAEVDLSVMVDIISCHGLRTVGEMFQHTAPAGESTVTIAASVDALPIWDIDSPSLHTLIVQASIVGGPLVDQGVSRFGVRDFDVSAEGFRLNGRPLLLKMTHTSNDYPLVWSAGKALTALRQDLIRLKELGFNTVRFIWGDARPEQIELCDQIGLLVYCESFSSWIVGPSYGISDELKASALEAFLPSMSAVMRRYRSHPSVVIWGLLNECPDGEVVGAVAAGLGDLRSIDPSRVFALNSGRFDGRVDLPSVSSAFSPTWDVALGKEGLPHPTGDPSNKWPPPPGGFPGTPTPFGDVHYYPRVPHGRRELELLEQGGLVDSGPILLSEYGVGSAVDLPAIVAEYEVERARQGSSVVTQDETFYRSALERFLSDYDSWGLTSGIGDPFRFVKDAVARMAGERVRGMAAVLANPRLIGTGVTGSHDQGMTGEGFTTTFRHPKPGAADAARQLFEPSRVSICGLDPVHMAGAKVSGRFVLSDEHQLAPGQYEALLQLRDSSGAPAAPLASLVLDHSHGALPLSVSSVPFDIDLPTIAGAYYLEARLANGLLTCPDTELHVVDAPRRVEGPTAPMVVWLDPNDSGATTFSEALDYCREGGSALICLRPGEAASPDEWKLPELGIAFTKCPGWLYQREDWATKCELLEGLPGLNHGLLDYGVWNEVIPDYLISTIPTCEPLMGSFKLSQDYVSGLTLARLRIGAGRALITTLWVESDGLMQQELMSRLLNAISDPPITHGEGRA